MVDLNSTANIVSTHLKTVLVKFGDCIAFSSDGGSDQHILEKEIRKAY